jgi:glycosyltransferase involved in cell wall biosynthesis
MHLIVDGIGARHGGAATVLTEFLQVAVLEPRATKITVFCSPNSLRKFELPTSEKIIPIEKPWIDSNYVLRVLWYEFLLAASCKFQKAHVIFVAANYGRGGFDIPHVTYVQQSLQFSEEAIGTHKSVWDRIRIYARKWQMKRSCMAATRVICQSNVIKQCVVSTFGIPGQNVEVVCSEPRWLPNGTNPCPVVKPLCEAPVGNRLLYIGSDAPYKMLDTATQGLQILRKVRPQARLFLTLPQDHSLCGSPGVVGLSYLDAPALREAYELADLLVLPSLVESGPQPPIEAMSVGTPVLIADRPYAHDICEDAAIFFDPHSPEDFAEKAIQLLSDDSLQQDLIAKGYALVERRRAAEPYKQIIQILLDAADGRGR